MQLLLFDPQAKSGLGGDGGGGGSAADQVLPGGESPKQPSKRGRASASATGSGGRASGAARGRSSGDGQGRGGGSARSRASSALCVLCQANPRSGNNPYCKEDKKEYQALRKDAQENNKLGLLESALKDMVIFRKILQDYREQCQPNATANGWARPPYDFTRVQEIIRKATVVRHGGKSHMVDYFDVVDIFKNKRMDETAAYAYFRKLCNDPALETDELGLNPHFPKRVEWRETGLKSWYDEVSHEQQTFRSSRDMKAAASDEAFYRMSDSMPDSNSSFDHPRFSKLMNAAGLSNNRHSNPDRQDTPVKKERREALASPERVKSGGGVAPSSGQAGVATRRLLAHDEQMSSFQVAAKALALQLNSAKAEVKGLRDARKDADFADYLSIIDERIEVGELVIEGVVCLTRPAVVLQVHEESSASDTAAQQDQKIQNKIGDLSCKPFDAVQDLKSFRRVQIDLFSMRKVSDEESLKKLLGSIMAALPLFHELVASLKVACEDLDKAKKERSRREKKVERQLAAEAKKAAKKQQVDKEKQSVEAEQKQAAQVAGTLQVEVYPFTAPTSVGTHMKTFATWSEAKGDETQDLLQFPFCVQGAGEIADFLDGSQCARISGKIGLFKSKWMHAAAVVNTGRTQSRLSKHTEPITSLLNEVVKAPVCDLPEPLSRLSGIAMFGVAKGNSSFQPDYLFMNCLRYSWEGDRSVVAIPGDAFLKWGREKNLLSSGAATTLTELQELGENHVDEAAVKEMLDSGVQLVHAHLGPKSAIYTPGGHYLWETVHSNVAGLRYSFVDSAGAFVQDISQLTLGGDEHGTTLKQLREWRCSKEASVAPSADAAPAPEGSD